MLNVAREDARGQVSCDETAASESGGRGARPRARHTAIIIKMRWVLGQCKYAHDAGCALLSVDGQRSVLVPNERIGSRRKHDGGDTTAAVLHALEAVGASLDDVVVSCANNHHNRIEPFERRLPWSVELGLYPRSGLAKENLLPTTPRYEYAVSSSWSRIAATHVRSTFTKR